MKDQDFQVGDKVTGLTKKGLRKGVVGLINTCGVMVRACDDNSVIWFRDGALYHGHNIRIEGEEKPVRYPWVNVYLDSDGDEYLSRKYSTKSEAVLAADMKCNVCHKYVATIQLKPKGE